MIGSNILINAFNGVLVRWLILSCTGLNVELAVFFTLFSKAIASLPKYGCLKYSGHLLGPCSIGFFNLEILLLNVFLIICDV